MLHGMGVTNPDPTVANSWAAFCNFSALRDAIMTFAPNVKSSYVMARPIL